MSTTLLLKYQSPLSAAVAITGVSACNSANSKVAMEVSKADAVPVLEVTTGGVTEKILGNVMIARFLCRHANQLMKGALDLFGATPLESTQIDHFLELADRELHRKERLPELLESLNEHLALRTVLVGNAFSLADAAAWGAIQANVRWAPMSKTVTKDFPHVARWLSFLETTPGTTVHGAKQILNNVKDQNQAKKEESSKKGSFDIDLPGATMGNVVVRFPPEPSGYLHIGHAKAVMLNQYFAKTFQGKLILRFEDTNPSKEKEEFVENIISDLNTLRIDYTGPTYTSDYFDLIISLCEKLLKEGKAFVDPTPQEEMKEERFNMIESKYRNKSVEENFRLWELMKKGDEEGLKCCVRAKVNMQSVNGCMRDPAIFRCNVTPHQRTGEKYKVYPTYDFACPIVDSIEGVTHTLRTIEYHDRNEQFDWMCDALGIRRPYIWDYSRLNMVSTVMSKRKLQWFVDQGLVEGWFDPRFPTVQGILRRGLAVETLAEFMVLQGASKNINFMEWDKLWSMNRARFEPVAPRYTALYDNNKVAFTLSNGPAVPENHVCPLHQKNSAVGVKSITRSNVIYLEQADALTLKEGEELTLMTWGNAIVRNIKKDAAGVIVSMDGELNPNGDVKKTALKATWLGLEKPSDLVPIKFVDYGHLITVKKVEEDMNIQDCINKDSKKEYTGAGELCMRNVKKGDVIQVQRKGFYICDAPYMGPSKPLVLFSIPDGKLK